VGKERDIAQNAVNVLIAQCRR